DRWSMTQRADATSRTVPSRRSSASTRSARSRARSSVGPPSSYPSSSVVAIPPRRSRRSVEWGGTTSSGPPGCSGNRGPSRTTRGAGWGSRGEGYGAIVGQRPYAVRGLVGFGANLLLAHADVRRGREALEALDFYVHADLLMSPTAELADIVLPVATPFAREGLKIGF